MHTLSRSCICFFLTICWGGYGFAQQNKVMGSGPMALADSLKGVAVGRSLLGKLGTADTKATALQLKDIAVGTGMQRIGTGYHATYTLDGQLLLFKLPVNLQFSNSQQQRLIADPFQGNLFKMGFDRQSFLRSLVPELDEYRLLRENVLGGKSATMRLREQLMAQLKGGAKGQAAQASGIYNYINQQGNLEQLLKLDQGQLREKLEQLAVKRVPAVAGSDGTVLRDSLDGVLLDSLVGKVAEMKGLLESKGISPERIADIERWNGQGDLQGYTSKYKLNPLGASGWQGWLDRLGDMELGSFGDRLPGSFMNRELFLQGGSVSLYTRRGELQLGLATSSDIGFAKDAGFSQSNFNRPKWLTFLSVPVLGNGFAKTRVSWTGSIEKQSYGFSEYAGLSSRSGSALTLSQEFSPGKMGRVVLELSKSVAAFRNMGQIGSEDVLLERNSFGNYFRDDLFETLAFGAKYELNDQRSRLHSNLFFNYAGIGFQNPAQQGFGNMGLRMGGAIRKGFLKNKLVLNIRGDLKNTPVGGTEGGHWQNHNLNVEARVRLGKKVNLSLKYMDNGVQKNGQEQQQSVYGSKKYQVDATSSYRLFRKSGFSHLVMGLQQMNNPISGANSLFLTSIYSQSISFGGAALTGNVFFNRELGGSDLLGDMLNADLALQYPLLQRVSASTGGVYLENTGQARQVGIKQNLQVSAWKNFELNFYADIRKNMVRPLYPELFANNRGEVSLKYYFR